MPAAGHVHPVPAIETSVKPAGTVSVTVTVPLVGAAATLLLTVTVYVAPFCPCVKFEAWVFVIPSDGEPQEPIVRIVLAALGSAMKRGIASVSDAAAPLLAENPGGDGA